MEKDYFIVFHVSGKGQEPQVANTVHRCKLDTVDDIRAFEVAVERQIAAEPHNNYSSVTVVVTFFKVIG